MKKLVRLASVALLVVGLTSTVDSKPAFAYFHHYHKHTTKTHHVHHKTKKHSKHAKANKNSAMIRDAQTSLINLGYYAGHPDGKMGPKTIKAIKAFQHDHSLPANGKLTTQTYNAIIKADSARAMASLPMPMPMPLPVPQNNVVAAQPGLVGPTHQDYADPLLGGTTIIGGNAQAVRTQSLTSRYAKLDINENINGNLRRYDLTLNGTPVLQVNNQPSIIGISQTYNLEQEDALILTTYHDGDPVCAYKHYLLTLAEGRNELRVFGNCTHGYQARVIEDSLFVTFPEVDDARVAGATWRYERGDLEKL